MFQTLKNAWKVPELKSKLLFTLLIVLLYRLGASIPVPYIDAAAMDGYVEQTEAYTSLFQNRSKYNAYMMALAGMMYREFNSPIRE